MHRLEEEAVRWLKSVSNVTLTEEIPEVLQQLLSRFRDLSSSTKRLDDSSKENAKVLAAARATVEQQLQKVVMATEAHPREVQQEIMLQRKAVLKNWLAKTEELVKDAAEKLQHQHVEIRNAFEDRIQEAIHLAFREWKEEPAQSPVMESFDDLKFMEELDAELQLQVGSILPLAHLPKNKKADETVDVGPTPTSTCSAAEKLGSKTPQEPVSGENEPSGMDENMAGGQARPDDNKTPASEDNNTPASEDNNTPASVDKVSTHRLIVPKGADKPVVQKKVNIFNRQVCKDIKWSDLDDQPPDVSQSNGSATVSPPPVTAQVAKAKAVPKAAPLARRAAALQMEFLRRDTSDLDIEDLEQVEVDGVTMYRNEKGKLETLKQREGRLAHNAYVRFSRSFTGLGVMTKSNHTKSSWLVKF